MSVTQISKIIIKKGLSENLPNALDEGELGYTTDTGELFIGAPNLPKIEYRAGTSTTNDGIFPYQNVKVLTEFDFPKTVTGDFYMQGPLTTSVIPSNNETSTLFVCETGVNTCFLNYSLLDDAGNMLGIGTIQACSNGINQYGTNVPGISFSYTWVDNVLSINAVNSRSTQLTISICAQTWTATTN